MKYFAIDFETASREQVSACSLGIVSGGDEGIQDKWYELIRPPVMDFDDGCIRIHQIHPEDVKDKPEFPSYWEEIARLLEGQVVFAHNAPFDMGVLAGTIDYYDLPDIHFYWGDTVTLSRRLWKDMPNHRLNTVAGILGFSFHHHQALADAEACAFIVKKALEETKAASLSEMMESVGLTLHPFSIKRTHKPVSLF
ncbi:MAG: 3'-5' exonuclease [Allisonella histaminiformans]|uniref:DNA polymerase-3 subunit epsilon n=1 Tax=Allisonella histaminiformans TaxID=209880 RepID=A0A1G5UVA9_9FIRM|nr:3'-5' exonuclease [Allisonella histaminiformans]PWL44541.1 MAG: exonuclease [Veillonellaceae bacterium]MCI6003369.1 3'-5' exonuclease [Allisonella histaminiformans]MDD6870610.1 3'-5' exonuclease [Allisonella histaminiformans]MDY4540536.1 3'-5' exonuclease [Allisonella histaminiformans]SDA37258.1 DNA polymerase-3 subunit epsilon [Allisonella histaminiformans]